jgi:hypothetical protein
MFGFFAEHTEGLICPFEEYYSVRKFSLNTRLIQRSHFDVTKSFKLVSGLSSWSESGDRWFESQREVAIVSLSRVGT